MLCVSAVQLAFAYASSPQEFFDRVGAPIERAAASTDAQHDGARLIALPDYTGLMLLDVAMPVAHESMQLGEIARARSYATVAAMLHAACGTTERFSWRRPRRMTAKK